MLHYWLNFLLEKQISKGFWKYSHDFSVAQLFRIEQDGWIGWIGPQASRYLGLQVCRPLGPYAHRFLGPWSLSPEAPRPLGPYISRALDPYTHRSLGAHIKQCRNSNCKIIWLINNLSYISGVIPQGCLLGPQNRFFKLPTNFTLFSVSLCTYVHQNHTKFPSMLNIHNII